MKKLCLILALLVTGDVQAQAIRRTVRAPPLYLLYSYSRNSGMAAAGGAGGTVLPLNRGFTITRVSFTLSTASSGLGTNTVVTITDGTNNCTATWACSATVGSTPMPMAAAVAGACTFPPGAALRATVTTAGCTTTQPSVTNIDYFGTWQ